MIEKAAFTYHVEEFLKESSSYLVDVIIAAGNKVTVEIDNDNGVHIEECVELSRYLESQFNRDEEDFELIVTSFGLTSPFKSLRQYKKYEG
ncbi:MAG TPA: ribosome assembly cofactor RimP, partial [Porphyromonadaceae bacterium]|nr:ribosome assembly cofactor RimP [Porphyromonadaceae bacterium]